MTNNDILRRLRYSFEFNDSKMITLFKNAELAVTREQISAWLKKEDDDAFVAISDVEFATFLNGFIIEKRGKREGPQPTPEAKLNFNIILTKLKIALSLQAEDIIELLETTRVKISKAELSAFFRKPDHKHYRECKAQLIRNFLMAVQEKYRPSVAPSAKTNKNKSATPQQHRQPQNNARDNETQKDNQPRTARPNASARYVNPKATKQEKTGSERKVLKLTPEDIWGKKD